ncbi:MAG: hypothetical protein NWE99_08035 [Candidatus Bathyarchaeota archaeon]|nr:hypothetical protein [Candidatus Bathyarchaeota archaeon]
MPDEIKLKVVQEYLNTDVTQKELKAKYGFGGNNCILNWMRKFGLNSPDKHQVQLQQTMTKESQKTPRERELEQKVKQLEKELEHEKLRTLALDTMINIAERELNIPIRKKSGAKR